LTFGCKICAPSEFIGVTGDSDASIHRASCQDLHRPRNLATAFESSAPPSHRHRTHELPSPLVPPLPVDKPTIDRRRPHAFIRGRTVPWRSSLRCVTNRAARGAAAAAKVRRRCRSNNSHPAEPAEPLRRTRTIDPDCQGVSTKRPALMRRKTISHRQDHHSGSRQDKNLWLFNPQPPAACPTTSVVVQYSLK
jgi:hypothetical protein